MFFVVSELKTTMFLQQKVNRHGRFEINPKHTYVINDINSKRLKYLKEN